MSRMLWQASSVATPRENGSGSIASVILFHTLGLPQRDEVQELG